MQRKPDEQTRGAAWTAPHASRFAPKISTNETQQLRRRHLPSLQFCRSAAFSPWPLSSSVDGDGGRPWHRATDFSLPSPSPCRAPKCPWPVPRPRRLAATPSSSSRLLPRSRRGFALVVIVASRLRAPQGFPPPTHAGSDHSPVVVTVLLRSIGFARRIGGFLRVLVRSPSLIGWSDPKISGFGIKRINFAVNPYAAVYSATRCAPIHNSTAAKNQALNRQHINSILYSAGCS